MVKYYNNNGVWYCYNHLDFVYLVYLSNKSVQIKEDKMRRIPQTISAEDFEKVLYATKKGIEQLLEAMRG